MKAGPQRIGTAMMRALKLGSRGSQLAHWQADHVVSLLAAARPDAFTELVVITTTGDRVLDAPLAKIGGKGLFTKEIEEALLDGRIDLAVHSLKDLPTTLPAGLELGAVLSRHDPSDVLIAGGGMRLADLPPGARIGTSSLRRKAQLLHHRPDLNVESIRGNVPTRLDKALSGALEAVVLARAGVERLGLTDRITEILPVDLLLPAPGQGAIGIEIRAADAATRSLLLSLQDPATRAATDAERSFLRALGGGCQVPIGAFARPADGEPGILEMSGMVAEPDGSVLLKATGRGPADDAILLGTRLAQDLIARGAGEILARLGEPPPDGRGDV